MSRQPHQRARLEEIDIISPAEWLASPAPRGRKKPDQLWRQRASWHDGAETVVSFDGLLFDAWSPLR
jgi:hypothetical protein